MNEIFLLDANAFITPYRQYYAFDIVPSFWIKLNEVTDSGKIKILDIVKDELNAGSDQLSDWIKSLNKKVFINRSTTEILKSYSAVILSSQT